MMAVCTTYYTDVIQTVDDPDLVSQVYTGRHGSARGRILWRDLDGKSRVAYAPAKRVYEAQVEGTAVLELTDGDRVVLQYQRHGRWVQVDAPQGLGSRNNALVVGRDIATNHVPWGSRILWRDIDDRLKGEISQVMFVADVFGVRADPDRFDLFVRHGVSQKVRMTYQVARLDQCDDLPWHPIRSLQTCLMAWDLYDGDIDGIVGPQTIDGVRAYIESLVDEDAIRDLKVYHDGEYPMRYAPYDPALYWWTRRDYCHGY